MTLCGPGLAGARTSSTARPAAAATPPSCATTIAAYRHPPRIDRLAAAASWLGNRGWQHLTGPTRASSPSAALSPAGIPAPFRSRAGFNRKYSPLLLATRACPSAAGLHAPELPRLPGEPLQLHVGVPGVRRAPRPPHHPSPPSDRAFAWGVRDPGGRGQWPACRPPRTAASRRRRRGPSLNR